MRQPTAMVRPHNALDALAYGGRMASAPPPVPRRGLWNTPGLWDTPAIAAAPVVYAAAPPPVVRDPAYRLDAGDRLRIVVYGQKASPTPIWSVPAAASPCH
jgi:polysaccharide export outer membrane protein